MNHCLECNNKLSGRSDKKFCSNYCRATFHNRKSALDFKEIKTINKILKKNRQLLYDKMNSEKLEFTLKEMEEKGFNFHYLTSYCEIKSDLFCKFCYEIGYLPIGKNRFKIKLKN